MAMRPKGKPLSEAGSQAGIPAKKVPHRGNMPNFGLRVRSIFQISALLSVCVLAGVRIGFACTPGGSTVTYQFVGQCTDCTGTAVGLLTLQNYTLGTALASCNFVSFTYSSNLTSFTITQATLVNLSGAGLPATLPGPGTVQVGGPNPDNFSSNSGGTWTVGAVDYGTGGTWSLYTNAVPTLSTAVLCALALLLAGAGALLVRARRPARV